MAVSWRINRACSNLRLRPKRLLLLNLQHSDPPIRRRIYRQNRATPEGAANNSPVFVATAAAADTYGENAVANNSACIARDVAGNS
jgi:hypothetical protein